MMDYDEVLREEERMQFRLRALYEQYGYLPFRSGKFEEYELYARNKDFLGADGILTFTDARGRLLALKPDVTLSIARDAACAPGWVEKYCYDEAIYRRERGSGSFRERQSVGIECIGAISSYDICEVISLAVQSLAMFDTAYVLNISHMGIVQGLTKLLDLPGEAEEAVLRCIADKNSHSMRSLCREHQVPEAMIDRVEALIRSYGPMDAVLGEISRLVMNETMQHAVDELRVIGTELRAAGLDARVQFDFSVVNDMGYYDGVIFQGFLEGLAAKLLSGGRYDSLMRKMGKNGGAIGFSLSPDLIAELRREAAGLDVDVVLLDRPGESLQRLGEIVRAYVAEGKRVSVQKERPTTLRYGTLAEILDGEVHILEQSKA